MPRILLLIVCFMAFLPVRAQDYAYVQAWHTGPEASLSKLKLLPTHSDRAYFLYPEESYFPDQMAWEWFGTEGGSLRIYLSESRADSAILTAGQQHFLARPVSAGWVLSGHNKTLQLSRNPETEQWRLTYLIDALPGAQGAPDPVVLLTIQPHVRKQNRFTIETLQQMESIPLSQLEMGIILSMLLESRTIFAGDAAVLPDH